MKTSSIILTFLMAMVLPFAASAQSNMYIVAEAGVVNNSMALSGDLSGLPVTKDSGTSFGGALGYRTLVSDNFVVGLEGNIASSSSSSSVTDGFDTITFEEDYVAGVYVTGGFAFGQQREALLYALVGVGFVGGETSSAGVTANESVDDSGDGFSFGGAFEYGVTESVGIRAKVLHTRYKGDVDELKIRDTTVMGGIVFTF